MTDWKNVIRERLDGLHLSAWREAEIVEELAQHLEDRYRELRAGEVTDEAATATVAAELNQSLARELAQIEPAATRDQLVLGGSRENVITSVLRDVRYGVRVLFKSRSFTAIAILMLALGIGANTAIFQLIDAVRLRSLPVVKPYELADVHIVDMEGARGDFSGQETVTDAIWEQLRANLEAFSGLVAYHNTAFNLASSGQARYASGLWVSGDFFNVLGVRPILGRVFSGADDRPGCSGSEAVISYSFWQREFGSDPGVIGRELTLDLHSVEVIGVTPPAFHGLEAGRGFDVAVPICSEPSIRGAASHLPSGTDWWLSVIGRLKAGWTLERASAHLGSISPAVFSTTLPPNYPADGVKNYLAFRLGAFPGGTGTSHLRKVYSSSLNLVLAIAGLVLLIACADLANLMLARANSRSREITIRLALGASRRRIVQQLMAESFLVAAAGATLGLVIANQLSGVLASMLATQDNFMFLDLTLDWRILSFAVLLAITTCVVFGLVPAFTGTRNSAAEALKVAARGTIGDRGRSRMRQGLVIIQVALSLLLVVQGLLFSSSLRKLMTVDAGFQQDGILVSDVDFSAVNLPAERRNAFNQDLVSGLRSVPAISGAASTEITPISGMGNNAAAWMDGKEPGRDHEVYTSAVSDGYFGTLGMPLLAGRDFNKSDAMSSARVAVVNEAFAREFTSGANPVGQRFWLEATPTDPATIYEIVGLVGNSKYLSMGEEFHSIAFFGMSQQPKLGTTTMVVVRSNAPMTSAVAAVRDAINQFAPSATFDFTVLRDQIMDSLLPERLLAVLSGFFGLLGLLLACVGLYGIVSYGVASRTGEIGIRLALGSTRAGVVGLIMRETSVVLLLGLVIGAGISIAAGLLVRSMLFGLSATDPIIFTVAIAALALTGAAAAFIPARRAAGVDPMNALRYE
ncbi:MAG TPA: ABC transporter permease [Blastocatellia bacterium]